MPISIPRLRVWFAMLAIAVVAVVAGFYFYARIQNRSFLKQLPQKLGVDIQQSSQGFSLSKSQGGRTLFTIRAANAVQYTGGGRPSFATSTSWFTDGKRIASTRFTAPLRIRSDRRARLSRAAKSTSIWKETPAAPRSPTRRRPGNCKIPTT